MVPHAWKEGPLQKASRPRLLSSVKAATFMPSKSLPLLPRFTLSHPWWMGSIPICTRLPTSGPRGLATASVTRVHGHASFRVRCRGGLILLFAWTALAIAGFIAVFLRTCCQCVLSRRILCLIETMAYTRSPRLMSKTDHIQVSTILWHMELTMIAAKSVEI
jgi:hypothetical protein